MVQNNGAKQWCETMMQNNGACTVVQDNVACTMVQNTALFLYAKVK